MAPRDLLFAFVSVLCLGLNFIAIKWGVALVPPLLLTALRFTFAAIPAVFFIKPPKVKLSILLVYGFTVGVLQFGSLFVAIKLGMPAGLSSLVIQMQVFFTIGLAVLFLAERPGPAQIAGAAAIALVGLVFIASGSFSGTAFVPLLLTLAAAAFWACANIVTKRAGRINMLAFVVWSALVPPLPLLALSLLTDGPAADWAALSHPSWLLAGVVGFNSFAATVTGFGLWALLLSRHPAAIVAPFALLVPVVGIVGGVIVLREPLSPPEAIGCAVIFCGLLVNVFGARLKAARRAAP